TETLSVKQETLRGQAGRSSSLTGVSTPERPGTKKRMKALVGRRRRAPSLTLDNALQKWPATKERPPAGVDTHAFLSSFVALLLDGLVELKRGLQRWERHLFLFNDLLVVAKIKYNNNFKRKNKIKLSDRWAASCVGEVGDGSTDAMRSLVLGWPTVNLVATFRPEQKGKWLSLLQRCLSLEKEDWPKSIPLKTFTKDIGDCACCKTITMRNSPFVLRELFLTEQLPRERWCQFTLQPSPLAAAQKLSQSGEKTFKRRGCSIKRGSSTRPGNLPMSPASPTPGKLFRVSLPSICENDNLPQPVSHMLFILDQKGPLTKGIFRLSANVTSRRELKEKLNSVIVSVLKDFLRNIPGSIFSSDLCHHWVCVMDQGNDEEKINTIQRLLDQLLRASVVLPYLFGVLPNIEQHSSSNQMMTFNLAVCITASILWPPASSSPELENKFINKDTLLIQFLIENCCGIFGEETTSLFGEVSVRCDTEQNASHISYYDSLEGEQNGAEVPGGDLVKNLGQGSRNMDSALTPSGDDLDQPEVDALLTLSDFDLDRSKNEDIRLLESKPVTVIVLYREPTLQDPAGPLSGMTTPSCLSTAAADAPESPRQHQCSEASTNDLDSKLSLRQERLRKSSRDAILSQKDEDHRQQNQPLQEEGKTYFKQSLVTVTDIKKSATNTNAKEESLFGNEGNHVNLLPESKPGAISIASCSHMSSRDHPRSQPFDSDTSGDALPHTRMPSRRQQHCSEPNADDQPSKLSCLRRMFSKKQKKTT
uniref:Rho-GAP domain-containing protein n=1 Tax=Myotis lucifugus TaxID=59463 RepID=G1Q4Y7_MYOLU